MTAPDPGQIPEQTLRVVVLVGTDHHPFNRLIEWVNSWLSQHPEQAAGFFVQAGTASVRPGCPWSSLLDVSQLDALLDQADLVVCHGGPASIANAWSRKQLPIVVPRLRRLGEHVDDHQLDFSRKIAGLGRVHLAQTPADFAELLAEAGRDISGFRSSGLDSAVDEVVVRFGALVDELVSRPRRRLTPGRQPFRRPKVGSRVPAAAAEGSPGYKPAANTTTSNANSSTSHVSLAGLAQEENE
jgi:UDP-N-acetylglucosamine transferase subunit ALG13